MLEIPDQYTEVTLQNVAGEKLESMFQRELARVMRNISDLDTKVTATRKITIEITFTPDEERSQCAVGVTVNSKLEGNRSVGSFAFLARDGSQLRLLAHDLKQEVMDLGDGVAELRPVRSGRDKAARNDD